MTKIGEIKGEAMRSMTTAALAIGLLATGVLAQTPRKPGNEEARIAYFAGQWNIEGEVKPFPGWPDGKFNSIEKCDWFAGGFQLVCRSEGTSPMGAVKAQSTLAYNPRAKTYTYYRISSLGNTLFEEGTRSGDVWTWTSESKVDGKLMRGRVTMTEQSPTSYVSKTEFSFDGGAWTVLEEMKATKVK